MQPRLASNLLRSQDDLKLLMPLSLPPKCWNYRFGPPHLVYEVLGIGPRVLHMPGKPAFC